MGAGETIIVVQEVVVTTLLLWEATAWGATVCC